MRTVDQIGPTSGLIRSIRRVHLQVMIEAWTRRSSSSRGPSTHLPGGSRRSAASTGSCVRQRLGGAL